MNDFPVGTLIEAFPIKLPDGTVLIGSLYRTSRRSGRRITVREGDKKLFDTDDCYDMGNATAYVDEWLEKEIERRKVADPNYIPTVSEAARNPDAFVDGMTETSQTNHGLPV